VKETKTDITTDTIDTTDVKYEYFEVGPVSRRGWICPICGRGINPNERICPYCNSFYYYDYHYKINTPYLTTASGVC
jgi:rubrerythrin